MKVKNKLNVKILLVSLFISVLSILTILLYFLGSQKKNFELFINDGKAYITKVEINKTNYLLNKFSSNYNLEYKDEIVAVKKGDSIKLNTSRLTNLGIYFDINKNSVINVTIKNGKDKFEKKLTNKDPNIIIDTSIRKEIVNFIRDISLSEIVLLLLLYCFISLLLYLIFYFINNMIKKRNHRKLFDFKSACIIFLAILLIQLLTLYSLLSVFNIYFIAIYIIALLLLSSLHFKNLSKNLSNLFFVLSSIFGISMILILPPFHVPDEAAHYFKAYSIFEPSSVTTIKGKKYVSLSKNVENPINMYNMDLLGYDYKVSVKDYFSDKRFKSKNSSETTLFYFDNTANLQILSYIPAALSIKACEIANLPIMVSYRLAKIINLLIFIFVGFHCLNILPKFKNIFFMIMMFPITIQQAGGINQDSITLSLCILFAAYAFKNIYSNNKLKSLDKIILVVIPIMLGLCKIGYFPITFITLFIKNDKFKNKKEAFLIKTFTIIPCLLLSGIQYLSAGKSTVDTNFYPISMLFSQPVNILKVCVRTFLNRFHFDMLTGLVDGFGWSTVWNFKLFTYISSLIFLVFLIFDGESKNKFSLLQRIFYFTCAFIMIGFIYASLLFGWTPLGNAEIDGLQCRYFIIPALLFYIALSNDKLSIKIKNRNFWMACCVSIVYILCIFSILYSFYL